MLDPIHDFLARVRQMTQKRSTELRLSYQEANALALTIAQLLAVKVEDIPEEGDTIIISGGSLAPSKSEE